MLSRKCTGISSGAKILILGRGTGTVLRNFSPGLGNLDPGGVPGRSGERCLHDLFDAVAARRGSAPAAMDHGRTISYGVEARSDRLARRLYKAGVSHGDRVGVSGGRSLDALVAFLGILKVGAASASRRRLRRVGCRPWWKRPACRPSWPFPAAPIGIAASARRSSCATTTRAMTA